MLGKRRDSAVPLPFTARGSGRQVAREFHQRDVLDSVDLSQLIEDGRTWLLDLPILKLTKVGVRNFLATGLFDLPKRHLPIVTDRGEVLP